MKQKEDRDLKYIVILFVGVLIIIGSGILYKNGKIFQPVIQECGKVIQRETTDGGLAGRITEGKLQMTG